MHLARCCWLAWLLAFSGLAVAHELTMAEMEVRETIAGEFIWQWTASGEKPASSELTPIWPASCAAEAGALRCGKEGLRGTLSVDGVGKRYSAAVVKVFWLDGQSRVFTLTAAHPDVQLYGSADDRRGMGEIASTYTVLGVEHILGGFDHLMFVLSLLFLVGFHRKLVYTISAFTLAHSLTLALSALGWLTLRSPPVEATIALSIMLVAAEALHKRETLSRRWPAVVAFLFGLVHGLGFAGALADIGLPQKHLFVALLTFNLGVELGQLFVVVLAYAVYRALAKWPRFVALRTPALYGIGGVAAYWSIGRIVTILA
ncbi:MAG TPA: HupE/UreJ family protein [Povalibacter sp.]|uniref:HupE/UreJ family protein n=1 Tax=Povalibacter sp. TaxID=1962978 RepID=UPI002BAF64AC|nr:HupE/UreJ family protein [Povalibacter sp.]HMN47087.1 HupE/UreJ family protein [Povalibacter sp.]